MKLYLDNGYFNFDKVRTFAEEHKIAFVYVIGGRGTGKTYGAIDSYLYDRPAPFIWLRRTQSQADIISKPEFNPFKKNAKTRDWTPVMSPISKYNSGIYEGVEDETGKLVPHGLPKGYTAALSTFSNIRGFDADDAEAIIWDEFIPEVHERPIKNEAEAFFNAYETVNRNRELEGRPPLIAFCLANSNDLGNPIFMYAGHVKTCLDMRKKGQDFFVDFNRGYMIIMLDESLISQMKKETVLYKYTGGTAFENMSLSNVFFGEADIRTFSRPLAEYKSVVTAGELTVYKHKGNQRPLYVTFHRRGTCPTYGGGDTELKRFAGRYAWLWNAYMNNRVEFEDYGAELLFLRYFK